MITFIIKIKMNYLDLLTEDLIEKILNNITDDIDNKIKVLDEIINFSLLDYQENKTFQ